MHSPTKTGPNLSLILFATAFASYISRLDSHVVNIALPSIATQFGVGTDKASIVVLSNLLTTTSALILAGKLGDKYGLVRMFRWGYIISIASAFACSLAPNFAFLVAARALQGLGSALLMSMAFAIIAAYIPPDRTGRSFGLISTAAALGMLTGAPLGGFITQILSWRWAFLLSAPVACTALFAIAKAFPNQETEKPTKQLDLTGALLLFAALSSLVLGLNLAKHLGWSNFAAHAAFICMAAALAAFLYEERHSANPLIHSSILANKPFVKASLAQFFSYMLLTGSNFFFPFYLIVYKGLTSAQAGMVLILYSASYVVFAPLAGRKADKISPPLISCCGLASAGAAALSFQYILKMDGLLPGLLWLVWLAASYSFTLSPNNAYAMRGNKGSTQGVAAGIYNTLANLGMIIGVLAMETAFSWGMKQQQTTVQQLKQLAEPELAAAFGRAYLAGGIACLAALAITAMMLRDSQKTPPSTMKLQQGNITPLP